MESVGIQLKPRVAIVGGGCAGLAAAAELAESGLPVTLYEASRQLGGRARGLNWKGCRLDNGQHILLGAYDETLRMLVSAGVHLENALQRLPLRLIQQGQFELRASKRLPAPLHILSGLLRSHGLSVQERISALQFMARLRLSGFRIAEDEPLDRFLARHRQPRSLIQWLWEPLCLAALNTPMSIASTRVFLNVLRDSFSRSRADSDLLLPRTDLSTLLAEPLAERARKAGSSILLNSAVTAITHNHQGFCVRCGEESAAFSHVILATSAFRAGDLIRDIPLLTDTVSVLDGLDYQPIYTVYLQYPGNPALPFPMIGMTGGLVQWAIDRGSLDGQQGLISVVISASGPHQDLTQQALAEQVAKELHNAFPQLAEPLWHKVIAEKRATFSCRPGMLRPEQTTALKGFYLAGDYTAGEYPATIEGAVRSGVKCARLLLENP